MKIAIIGFSATSYDQAPWHDPTWEKWGMPWDAKGWRRYDRLFEMHSPILWDVQLADPLIEFWDGEKFHRKLHRPLNYYVGEGDEPSILVAAANDPKVKLYVQTGIPEDRVKDNKGLIEYPFERVIDKIGADYFQSSVAYALALAIAGEHTSEIGLWGIDVHGDEEWSYQRACIEYLVGIARGMGINVFIPESSALCKFQDQMIKFGAIEVDYTERYGIIKQPQTFRRWTLGDKYTLCQLRKLDLPEDLKRDVEFNDS
ncbi:MAG: hypothetical protein H8D23_23930 [Candidatus Brocadiales bacterium]|nr:hypothetical protein [Candidatus Brocadiales bacterium]